MFAFWKSKADAEPETVVEPVPAALEPVESPALEPEATPAAAVEVVAAEAALEAPPAPEPEPTKMPHKVLI
jgi:hypothetical protein